MCVPSSIAIGEMHRNTKTYTFIHYVGVIPGFPKSPRCILQCSYDGSYPHFSTQSKRCVTSAEPRSGRNRRQLGDRWTKPQQQITCSFPEVHFFVTCDILDEHTDCNRCVSWRRRADLGCVANSIQHNVWRYFWENGEYLTLFLAELQKTKTLCI